MRNNRLNLLKNTLVNRIEKVMLTPYADGHATGLEKKLWAASLLYGVGTVFRRKLYQNPKKIIHKLPVPVISIGNLTVGGTGKTPMAIYLARLLRRLNYRPAVISRGYGGTGVKKGTIVGDGTTVLADADSAGDEPLMMAKRLKNIPVLVGRNRYRSGLTAIESFGCDSIILDDGFQHMALHRDLNIVLLDAENPMGNGHLLPRGVLREPVSAMADAHMAVFTRSSAKRPAIPSKIAPFLNRLPFFRAVYEPCLHTAVMGPGQAEPLTLKGLNGKSVFLFSGIARNDDFCDTVTAMGATVRHHAKYGDHYRYGPKEIAHLFNLARQTNSELILTTEKDYARLNFPYSWPLPFAVIGVNIIFPNDAFDRCVMRFINSAVSFQQTDGDISNAEKFQY